MELKNHGSHGGRPVLKRPLVLVTLAIAACNLLAYAFFFEYAHNVQSPARETGLNTRQELERRGLLHGGQMAATNGLTGTSSQGSSNDVLSRKGRASSGMSQAELRQQQEQKQADAGKAGSSIQGGKTGTAPLHHEDLPVIQVNLDVPPPGQHVQAAGSHVSHAQADLSKEQGARSPLPSLSLQTHSQTATSSGSTSGSGSKVITVTRTNVDDDVKASSPNLQQGKAGGVGQTPPPEGGSDGSPAGSSIGSSDATAVMVPNKDVDATFTSVVAAMTARKRMRNKAMGIAGAAHHSGGGSTSPRELPDPGVAANQTDWPLWWFAPYFDRTSFGQEAATLVLGALRSGAINESNLWIGTSQGHCDYGVDTSMPRVNFDQLEAAKHRVNSTQSAIVVCHSLPPFWARPKNKWETCAPCPPVGYKPAMAIGRAMAETDIYHSEFVKYCNRMDEVWVPSDFSRDVLQRSGVNTTIRIVPIAVNTTLYDPDKATPLNLPRGKIVFGFHKRVLPPSPPPAAQAHQQPMDARTVLAVSASLRHSARRAGKRARLNAVETVLKMQAQAAKDKHRAAQGQAGQAGGEGTDAQGPAKGGIKVIDASITSVRRHGRKGRHGGHHAGAAAASAAANDAPQLPSVSSISTDSGRKVVVTSEELHAPAATSSKNRLKQALHNQITQHLHEEEHEAPAAAGGQHELVTVSGGGDDDGVEQVAAVQGRRLMAVSGTDAQAGGSAGITTAVHSTSSGSGHTSLGSRLRRLLDSVTAPDGNTVGADNEAVAPATSSPARHDDIATSSRTSHEQKQQAQGSKELKLQGVPATAGSHTQPVAASSGAGAAADLNTLVASKEGAATVAASPPPASPPPPPELRPYGSMGEGGPVRPKPFVFVSTFKWEMRKGWDSLLAAYLQEFSCDDNVELYILTKPFLSGSNFVGDMHKWARENLNITQEMHSRMPTLYVIDEHLTFEEYAGLYKAADAYVIPTRGEGWGMPITEAMSMGIPVVVTNWSGVTAFVDESVGYLVDYSLARVPNDQPWWFRGARWAEASVPHLRKRLRQVMSEPEVAAAKGRRARERMVSLYSPEVLGRTIAAEYDRIRQMLRTNTCDHCNTKEWVAAPGDVTPDLYFGNEPFIVGEQQTNGGGLVGTANLLQQGVTLASFSGVQQANVWKHIIATINSASQANQHLIKQIPGKEDDEEQASEEEEEDAGAAGDEADADQEEGGEEGQEEGGSNATGEEEEGESGSGDGEGAGDAADNNGGDQDAAAGATGDEEGQEAAADDEQQQEGDGEDLAQAVDPGTEEEGEEEDGVTSDDGVAQGGGQAEEEKQQQQRSSGKAGAGASTSSKGAGSKSGSKQQQQQQQQGGIGRKGGSKGAAASGQSTQQSQASSGAADAHSQSQGTRSATSTGQQRRSTASGHATGSSSSSGSTGNAGAAKMASARAARQQRQGQGQEDGPLKKAARAAVEQVVASATH